MITVDVYAWTKAGKTWEYGKHTLQAYIHRYIAKGEVQEKVMIESPQCKGEFVVARRIGLSYDGVEKIKAKIILDSMNKAR